jgi:hypothetical protein
MTYCHSRTADLSAVVREADVVVAAVGRPRLIRGEDIKPGTVVVDAGYTPGNVGDVDFDTARVVLTLSSVDSVRTLIATTLQPWSTARTTASTSTMYSRTTDSTARSTRGQRPSRSSCPTMSWTRPSCSRASSVPRTSEQILRVTVGAASVALKSSHLANLREQMRVQARLVKARK